MDQIKQQLKALDPQMKFIVWAGLSLVCFVLFGFLQVLPGANGFKVLGEASHLPYGSLFLIVASLCCIIAPLAAIALTYLKKQITAFPAYIFAAVALFILLLFDFKQVAGIFWLTFILGLAYAFVGYLLNGDKADIEKK